MASITDLLSAVQSANTILSKIQQTLNLGLPGLVTNGIALTNLAQIAANTILGNNTVGVANVVALTVPQVAAMFTAPTVQTFTSGSGTYTTPANVKYIVVELVGGGGGGAGSGTAPGAAGDGGDTTFGTLTGAKGIKAVANLGGAGGAATNGDINQAGAAGGSALAGVANTYGGCGGATPYGGNGQFVNGTGNPAVANSGSGGAGGVCTATVSPGGGGGAGGWVRKLVAPPSATYAYGVGAAGTAGTAGAGGFAGGAGAAGRITVYEYYQ